MFNSRLLSQQHFPLLVLNISLNRQLSRWLIAKTTIDCLWLQCTIPMVITHTIWRTFEKFPWVQPHIIWDRLIFYSYHMRWTNPLLIWNFVLLIRSWIYHVEGDSIYCITFGVIRRLPWLSLAILMINGYTTKRLI